MVMAGRGIVTQAMVAATGFGGPAQLDDPAGGNGGRKSRTV
jgi:hypothetical protein